MGLGSGWRANKRVVLERERERESESEVDAIAGNAILELMGSENDSGITLFIYCERYVGS